LEKFGWQIWQRRAKVGNIEKAKSNALVGIAAMLSEEVMGMHNVSVSLNDDDYKWVEESAQAEGLSVSAIMREMVGANREEYMKWKGKKVKDGLEALRRGDVMSHEDAGKRLSKMFKIKT